LDKSGRFSQNLKNWVGLENSVDMDFKNEKSIKKIGLQVKSDSTQKNILTQ
jgi:hypothetical protein